MSLLHDNFRELIALLIMGMFFYAYAHHTNDGIMNGALIAAFSGAWGYYLGSSKRSSQDPTPVKVTNDTAHPVPVEGAS